LAETPTADSIDIHESLRSDIAHFLLNFVVLDNSIASLFCSTFFVRQNSVEIIYANIPLQARLDTIRAICTNEPNEMTREIRKEVISILDKTRELQALRNLVAHNILLDRDLIIRGHSDEYVPGNKDPNFLYVWKTGRDGKYKISKITRKQITAAYKGIVELSGRIMDVCVRFRMTRGKGT
jgi:hypothetical protein